MIGDWEHAHFAALDILRAGGDTAAAYQAASDAVRPVTWFERPTVDAAVAAAVEEFTKEGPMTDFFAVAKLIAEDNVADIQKARADLAYLVTVYGPVEVAAAARAGLVLRPVKL